jgi:hypothetical protein
MDTAEFRRRAFALVGAHEGWRSRIARRLEINDRTVRRWLSDDDVPPWVFDRLPEPDAEWIIGDGMSADGVRRDFVLHTGWPAFVAWVPPSADRLRVLAWLDMVDDAVAQEWLQLGLQMFNKREGRDGGGSGEPAAASATSAGCGAG